MVSDGVYPTRFDIYETENEWIFRCKMPDVQLVQLETAMKCGELVIRGKVRSGLEAVLPRVNSRPHCFFRSFPISGAVNIERASATFKHGVLTIQLPKVDVRAP
jgi:HSP20 family molecular chaperone IbpA